MRPGADDDRRRRRDRDAVGPGRGVRRDPAEGAGADVGDRRGGHRQRRARRPGASSSRAAGGLARWRRRRAGARSGASGAPGGGRRRRRRWPTAVEALLVELGGGDRRGRRSRPRSARCSAIARVGSLLVAEDDGAIVGVLGRQLGSGRSTSPGRYATIQDLWVDPRVAQPRGRRRAGRGARRAGAGAQGVARIEVGLPREGFAALADRGVLPRPASSASAPRMRRRLPDERAVGGDGRAASRRRGERAGAPGSRTAASGSPGATATRALDELDAPGCAATPAVRGARRRRRRRDVERTLYALHDRALPGGAATGSTDERW